MLLAEWDFMQYSWIATFAFCRAMMGTASHRVGRDTECPHLRYVDERVYG